VAVVAPQDGTPSLMFRVANARGNQVVEAQLRIGMLRTERTAEGELVRRMHDLKLVRASSAVFALSWTAIHPLTPDSKLYGETAESLRAANAQIYCSLTGLDSTFSQTIHSRHAYAADDIRWGERFVDILGPLPDGQLGVNYSRFHDTYKPS
jgi:inward rectifier potassium channel